MKKSMMIFLAMLMLCMGFVITGCGSTSGDSKGNNSEYECPGAGFGFDLPEGMKITNGCITIKDLGDVDYDSGVMMGWPVYHDLTMEKYEALTNETADQAHPGFSFEIVCVKDVNSEDEAKQKILDTAERINGGNITDNDRETILSYKVVHQENGYIWLSSIGEKSTGLREENMAEYDAFYDASEQIINNMKFFTPEVWKGTGEGTALSFETVDLNGDPVKSENLFAQNKVTMINIWATTCGPCIEEMPELEEMNKEFQQKGGAIIGLVDDVWVNNMKYIDEAQAIVKDTGVTYTNLCAWDGFDDLLEAVGTPTTYFVDSEGKLIGDPILGANPEKYREKMEEYLATAK